jgi:hypothetical protein
MRVHFSPIATVFVALLFVSGTVGCRSNGGDWYNPKSYAFTNPFANVNNPFAKDNQAPAFSPNTQSNTKPSIDSHPNISIPNGGYTDEAHASRVGSAGMTVSSSPPAHWGQHNPLAQQSSPNTLGGYSDPEPSQYLSYSDFARHGAAPASHPHAPNHNPYLYQPEAVQHATSQMHFGNDYMQPNYQTTSAFAARQPVHSAPPGAGAYGIPMQPGSHAPLGTVAHDPHASIQHHGTQHHGFPMPSPVPGFEHASPGPYVGLGYPGEFAPAPSHHHPPAIGGGYNASY